ANRTKHACRRYSWPIKSRRQRCSSYRINLTSSFRMLRAKARAHKQVARAAKLFPCPGSSPSANPREPWMNAARRHRVLVVEDEFLVRIDLVDRLEMAGFNVLEAGTAAEAVKIFEGDREIAAVFTDINLPGTM